MQEYISEEALRQLYPRGYAIISVDHIRHNLEVLHHHSGLPLYCVVKANAYGHGAALISPWLENLDCVKGFATATVHEAKELREAGIKKEILVLGTAFPGEYRTAIEQNITLTVYRLEDAKSLSKSAIEMQKTVDVHVAIDTGMGRIGLPATVDSVQTIRDMMALAGLRVCGMFTHFARADEQDDSFTHEQMSAFQKIRNALADVDIDCWHVSNSAAILVNQQVSLDAGRAGIAMYGIYPSADVRSRCLQSKEERVRLLPALSWHSSIAHLKTVESGTPISYGSTYITPSKMRIATIPIGYGDGYPRSLSGIGQVLIGGHRCPILGRICMDQFMVDVSELDGVELYDPVVLLGRQGEEEICLEELTEAYQGFHYEFLCDINLRVPRLLSMTDASGNSRILAD